MTLSTEGTAGVHAPEGTNGQDLSDFGSAFDGIFSQEETPRQKQDAITNNPDDEEEEFDGEGNPIKPEPIIKQEPIEAIDPLAGLEEKQRAAKDKWKAQQKEKAYEERIAQLEAKIAGVSDVKNVLKGKTHDEIVDLALAAMEEDGATPEQAQNKVDNMTQAELVAKVKEDLRKEMEEERKQAQIQNQSEQALNNFREKIKSVSQEKAGEYPLVGGLGGDEQVFRMISEDYEKNEKEFGQEFASKNMMTIDQGLKKVNEVLASSVLNALKSEHVKNFIIKALKDGSLNDKAQDKSQLEDFSQLEDYGNTTLTNNVHRKVTDPKDIRELSDEEQLAQAFSYVD